MYFPGICLSGSLSSFKVKRFTLLPTERDCRYHNGYRSWELKSACRVQITTESVALTFALIHFWISSTQLAKG